MRKDNNMDINEVPRKKMATEWDMGWFCDKCEKLVHWKTKSYEVNGQHLCRECAEIPESGNLKRADANFFKKFSKNT